MRRLALLTLFVSTSTAALLPACGPGKDPGDTEGATEGATDGDTTKTTEAGGTSGTTADDPTGGPVTTTTEGSGTVSATGTGDATDSETGVASNPATSNTETDTGLSDPNWEASCTAACENMIACDPEAGPLAECVEPCVFDFMDIGRDASPACVEALLNYNLCVAGADCRAIAEEPCGPQEEAIEEACFGDVCSVGVMPPAGGDCGKSLNCRDADRMILCEGDTCTCFENDVETKSCPSAMVCEGEDWAAALDAAALECCGFEL